MKWYNANWLKIYKTMWSFCGIISLIHGIYTDDYAEKAMAVACLAMYKIESIEEKQWEKINKEHNGANECITKYLLGDGNKAVYPTEKEVEIMATVIQWLGSPVGQYFLQTAEKRIKEETK